MLRRPLTGIHKIFQDLQDNDFQGASPEYLRGLELVLLRTSKTPCGEYRQIIHFCNVIQSALPRGNVFDEDLTSNLRNLWIPHPKK